VIHDTRRYSADVSQIPRSFEGRAEHLYELRDIYVTEVTRAGKGAGKDKAVKAAALALRRA